MQQGQLRTASDLLGINISGRFIEGSGTLELNELTGILGDVTFFELN